jgi:hypothetical protein
VKIPAGRVTKSVLPASQEISALSRSSSRKVRAMSVKQPKCCHLSGERAAFFRHARAGSKGALLEISFESAQKKQSGVSNFSDLSFIVFFKSVNAARTLDKNMRVSQRAKLHFPLKQFEINSNKERRKEGNAAPG